MTPEERERLLAAFQRDDEDDAALADVLYLHKLRVYSDTLGELADGYDYEYADITLSQPVLDALREEAELRAGQINATFNSEAANFIRAIVDEASYDEAVDSISEWSEVRETDRAQLIAVTEAYAPHADATMAFFASNGIETEFDFGGHGDDHPACSTCEAIFQSNPHPLDRVLEIGTPHIQCRQNWHPLIDPDTLPDEIILGDVEPSGIVGKDTLTHRAGGQSQATEQVEGLGD